MDVTHRDTLRHIVHWETKGNHCADSYAFKSVMTHDGSLPTIEIPVEGKEVRALVNTGCTATLIHSDFSNGLMGTSSIKAVNRKEVACGYMWMAAEGGDYYDG